MKSEKLFLNKKKISICVDYVNKAYCSWFRIVFSQYIEYAIKIVVVQKPI